MPQSNRIGLRDRLTASAGQTLSMAVSLLPILIGVVLLTGLLLELLPAERMAEWFGRSDVLDAFFGVLVGSVASGHPLTSYVLGGELLDRGVSLISHLLPGRYNRAHSTCPHRMRRQISLVRGIPHTGSLILSDFLASV
jgi:hypothetical protein